MRNRFYKYTVFFFLTASVFLFFIAVPNPVVGQTEIDPDEPQSFAPVVFSKSDLMGTTSSLPTSLQFGPDDKLYVADMFGTIRVYDVVRNDVDDYVVTGTEVINTVSTIPNFDDNGSFNSLVTGRLVTGILVAGEANNPVIYVASSDPRTAGQYEDIPLDTNSGILSMVTQSTPGSWSNPNRLDLVRGIPRNKENHVPNGLQIRKEGGITYLYLAQAGNTNMGAPSSSFAFQSEYALSAAILKIDLDALMALPTISYTYPNGVLASYKYDLPTLDDPDRAGDPDLNDPFGGNSALPWAKNQARLVPGGPVQLHATGFRNPYDVLIASDGRMYTIDNGANKDWGGPPENEGPLGNCTNSVVNNSLFTYQDNLHYVRATDGTRYYGGHPNPVRGNPAGIFGSEGNSPVPFTLANPVECDFRAPGAENGALATWYHSTNGLAEYTASNFGGELQGDLLAAGWNSRNLYRVKISYEDSDNPMVEVNNTLFSNVGYAPLDVIAQGDQDPFPGTIWVAEFLENRIIIFEPQDMFICLGTYDSTLDEDEDGYSNADEIDNTTSPCNPADIPDDNDGDLLSNLNDPDDDNDNLLDEEDPFAIDAENGKGLNLPVDHAFNSTNAGILSSGFTGLMSNGSDNYQNLYDPVNLTAGGAGGVFTIDDVPAGTAYGNTNTLAYGFQFGINSCEICLPFTVEGVVLSPLQTISGTIGSQTVGMFIGTGDQDNYISIMAHGSGGFQLVYESDGVVLSDVIVTDSQLLSTNVAAFSLTIDPVAATVQPGYSLDGGARVLAGSPLPIPTGWLDGETGMAVGIMASRNGSDPFSVTWDRLTVRYETPAENGIWSVLNSTNQPQARHENGFVELNGKFYLIGGRGIKPVDIYDPVTDTWSAGAPTPLEIHHFQAVTWNGSIYVIGAMTGPYPNETPIPYVLIYDPYNDLWLEGPEIPRPRGGAGLVVYNNKIYMVGGIENGHTSGTQPWFDEFNPSTNTWRSLTDAPHARDHVHAALLDGKLFVAGGRMTDQPVPFDQTIAEVDVFDFATATWSSPTDVPTERAGAGLVTLGNEVVLIGGESPQPDAHEEVEAYNYVTNSWRVLANLPATPTDEDRHGTQAIVYNDSIYMAAGSGGQGGSPELNSQVKFSFGNACPLPQPPSGGLSADPETLAFGTRLFGQPVTATVTLSADNFTGPVMVLDANVVGADKAAFTVSQFNPTYLNPGETMTVNVVFDPLAPEGYGIGDSGQPNAALSLQHSGWNSALVVPLSGAAVENETPISGLSASNDGPTTLGSNTTFSASITAGSNVSYSWDFGDGFSGSNASHPYTAPGIYTATVTAVNLISMETAETVVVVEEAITSLTASNDGPTALGSSTTLSAAVTAGSNIVYTWSFGDGSNGSGASPSHNYLAAGTYTATVTAENSVSTETAETVVIVEEGISGLAAINNGPTTLGSPTTLSATVTAGNNVLYTWNFGDGSNGTGPSPSHIYAAQGIYTATVTAQNSVGMETAETVVIVEEGISGLTASNNGPTTLGSSTTMSAALTAGSNVLYTWNFGDGTNGTGASPGHIYAAPGIYTATVTAQNSVGMETAETVVIVEEAITSLTVSNDGPTTLGSPTTLSAAVTEGSNVIYTWNFGDGTNGAGSSPNHTYLAAGNYTATVTAQNAVSFETAEIEVVVEEAISGLNASNDGPTILGSSTTFSVSITAGTNVSYIWDFGDGFRGGNASHLYAAPGVYTATVTASNLVSMETAETLVVVVEEEISGLTASNDGPTTLGNSTAFTVSITAGTNVSYIWDFGDGFRGGNASHIYAAPGIYTATVTAQNSAGMETAETVVVVEETISGLTASNDGPTTLGNSTAFSASITAGSNVSYIWDFGDGNTGSGSLENHVYASPGIYMATVTVTNALGTQMATTIVVVEDPVSFIYLPIMVKL